MMLLSDWYKYKESEAFNMGAPARERRKANRRTIMAGKQAAVKSGVWLKLGYVDGEALNKLSQVFIGAVNDYRNNPNAETEANMNFHGKSFKDAWKAVK